jgi:hypothetical protein
MEYIRICSCCGKEMKYKTKASFSTVCSRNPVPKCKSCALSGIKKPAWSNDRKEKMAERMSGPNNPMYGKTFIDVWEGKYSQTEVLEKRKEHSTRTSVNNAKPMAGVSVYRVWLSKYGQEDADLKMMALKQKMSERFSGPRNPMFGKPAPVGSGNGWSGWYDGFHFRSFLELCYIHSLTLKNISFESAEKKKYAIQYNYNEVSRTYFCDFHLLDDGIFVEVKPKSLKNIGANECKFTAAKNLLGDKFVILTEDDIPRLTKETVRFLIDSNVVIFNDSCKEKVEKYVNS